MRTAPLSLARSGSQREVDGGSVLALSSLCSPVLSIGAVGLQVLPGDVAHRTLCVTIHTRGCGAVSRNLWVDLARASSH